MTSVGYGVCAVCRQIMRFDGKGEMEWYHLTPDISHKPVLKSWDNDWTEQ